MCTKGSSYEIIRFFLAVDGSCDNTRVSKMPLNKSRPRNKWGFGELERITPSLYLFFRRRFRSSLTGLATKETPDISGHDILNSQSHALYIKNSRKHTVETRRDGTVKSIRYRLPNSPRYTQSDAPAAYSDVTEEGDYIRNTVMARAHHFNPFWD